jgi:hypothetical protein
MRRTCSILVPALALSASIATAEPILTSVFSHGTSGDGPADFTQITVCSASTNATTLTLPCAGSLSIGASTGHFAGLGEAAVQTVGELSLGSATSLDGWRVNPGHSGLFPQYWANGETTAGVTDTVTVLAAGSHANGILQLVFDVDGSITESVDFTTLDGFNPSTTDGDQFFAFGDASLSANGVSADATLGSVTLEVPLLFGSPQPLALTLRTSAGASIIMSEGYRVVVDFLNSATLTDAMILDASGQILSDATLLSSSGYTYGDLTSEAPQAVPEPATLTMMGLGLAALYGSRRRRSTR